MTTVPRVAASTENAPDVAALAAAVRAALTLPTGVDRLPAILRVAEVRGALAALDDGAPASAVVTVLGRIAAQEVSGA